VHQSLVVCIVFSSSVLFGHPACDAENDS